MKSPPFVAIGRHEKLPFGVACTDACRIEHVIQPGSGGRIGLVCHDPTAHEDFGRRMAGPNGSMVACVGPLRVDRLRRLAWVEGRRVETSPNEWALLYHLAARPETLCSPAELLTAVWGTAYVDAAHLLRVNVSRLRGKLYPFGSLIRSHPGQGYLLTADPEVPPIVPPNVRPTRWGRWSIDHAFCVCCGRTDVRHAGYGRCERCQHRGGRSTHYGPCGAPPADEGCTYGN